MEFYRENFKSYGQQIGHTKIHMNYFHQGKKWNS